MLTYCTSVTQIFEWCSMINIILHQKDKGLSQSIINFKDKAKEFEGKSKVKLSGSAAKHSEKPERKVGS